MTKTSSLLTQAEAAALSGAAIKAVQKSVEQGVVKHSKRAGRSLLGPEDVATLALFAHLPIALPIPMKKKIRSWVTKVPETGETEFHVGSVLWLSYTSEIADVRARTNEYVRLRKKYIDEDSKVMGGIPVVRGSRVPVRTLAELVNGGESREALREDYPHVPEEAYDVAVLWAKANPRRGRRPSQPAGASRNGRAVDRATPGTVATARTASHPQRTSRRRTSAA